MTRRKHLPLIRIALMIVSLALIQFFSCAQDNALIDFSQGFIGVSGNGPDQSLLYNKENNLILNHCIEGAKLAERRKLKLPQIEQRLEELSKGKLILKLLHQEKILPRPPVLVQQKAQLDQSHTLVSILKGESSATLMRQFQELLLKRK